MNERRRSPQPLQSHDNAIPRTSSSSSSSSKRRLPLQNKTWFRCKYILPCAVLGLLVCAALPSLYFLHQFYHHVEWQADNQRFHDQNVEHPLQPSQQERSLSRATNEYERIQERNSTNLQQSPLESEASNQHLDHSDGTIPNIVVFTHYKNLLTANLTAEFAKNDADSHELFVLQQNVRHIVQLHPTAQIRFLTDDDCRQSIANVFAAATSSDEHESQPDNQSAIDASNSDKAQQLVDYFDHERAGMYKADLCRGAALWETGGLYFDVDLGVRMNVITALEQSRQAKNASKTTFCTVLVHRRSHRPGAFFQAFIGVTPRNAMMKRYVELFLDYYQGKLPEYKGEPLGVVLLKRAMDEILVQDPKVAETIDLWQEVLYTPKMEPVLGKMVPYPTWGTRRACKFIVLTSVKTPFSVPFYSRIAGSRMCPALNTTDGLISTKTKRKHKRKA